MMRDCNSDIRAYHAEAVKLTQTQVDDLRTHRNSNRTRLQNGLGDDDPEPKDFVIQGSYAMHTIIQEPDGEYDIDDGVVFTKESLEGSRGGDKSPLDARHMVCDAVHDERFATPPEVKANCVRVYYQEGHHVDVPVYRECEDEDGDGTYYELASSTWRPSDPRGVNAWFRNWIEEKREAGQTNSREVIRLLKSICKSRTSYSLPSGFVLTVLVEECYQSEEKRLDENLRDTIAAIVERLDDDLSVAHPVIDGEWLIDSDTENRTRDLRDLCSQVIEWLTDLDADNCTDSKALGVWKKVFNNTDFFDERIKEAEESEKAASAAAVRDLGTASPKQYGHNSM